MDRVYDTDVPHFYETMAGRESTPEGFISTAAGTPALHRFSTARGAALEELLPWMQRGLALPLYAPLKSDLLLLCTCACLGVVGSASHVPKSFCFLVAFALLGTVLFF